MPDLDELLAQSAGARAPARGVPGKRSLTAALPSGVVATGAPLPEAVQARLERALGVTLTRPAGDPAPVAAAGPHASPTGEPRLPFAPFRAAGEWSRRDDRPRRFVPFLAG